MKLRLIILFGICSIANILQASQPFSTQNAEESKAISAANAEANASPTIRTTLESFSKAYVTYGYEPLNPDNWTAMHQTVTDLETTITAVRKSNPHNQCLAAAYHAVSTANLAAHRTRTLAIDYNAANDTNPNGNEAFILAADYENAKQAAYDAFVKASSITKWFTPHGREPFPDEHPHAEQPLPARRKVIPIPIEPAPTPSPLIPAPAEQQPSTLVTQPATTSSGAKLAVTRTRANHEQQLAPVSNKWIPKPWKNESGTVYAAVACIFVASCLILYCGHSTQANNPTAN